MITRSTRRRAAALVVSVLTVVAASCTRDLPLEPDEDVVGTYALTAVSGQALPQVLGQDSQGRTVELLAGSVVLQADLSFTEILSLRATPAGGESETTDEELSGTYSVSGRTVSFSSPQVNWQATASNGSLIYEFGSVVLLFEME